MKHIRMGLAIRREPLDVVVVVVVVVRSARPCNVASLAVTTRNEWILGLGAVGTLDEWEVEGVVVVVVDVIVVVGVKEGGRNELLEELLFSC